MPPAKMGDCANPVPIKSTGQLCGKVNVVLVTGPISGLAVCLLAIKRNGERMRRLN